MWVAVVVSMKRQKEIRREGLEGKRQMQVKGEGSGQPTINIIDSRYGT